MFALSLGTRAPVVPTATLGGIGTSAEVEDRLRDLEMKLNVIEARSNQSVTVVEIIIIRSKV